MQQDISIDKPSVIRAVCNPLKAYNKLVKDTGYDGTTMRPGAWDEDQALAKALLKSKYVAKHLDWEYLTQLIYSVLDSNAPLDAAGFAEKLEQLIICTASHRDYLAIFPLSFRPAMAFSLPGMQKPIIKRQTVGKFKISPSAPTVESLNRIIAGHKFPKIDVGQFLHAQSTSNKAFSRDMVVTFEAHGAEEQLRQNADIKFTHFRRLVEVFGVLFGEASYGFSVGTVVNHFFLLNKSDGSFRRLPVRAPSFVDLAMDVCLQKAIGQPAFNDFLTNLLTASDPMYGRMKNAIKFFSMALNADDGVSSFLFYVIAMESIFSRDKNNPIKVTLADLGAMLCFPPSQRLSAHQRIREAYDLRSAIVHNGASSVARKDVIVVRSLAARAIYSSLFLCHHLRSSGEGKLDDLFFNHLRDQRLGLVKGVVPRQLWALPEIADSNIE